MVVHFKDCIFDFENMYYYASFSLRKNHADLRGQKGPRDLKNHKPNMKLITFWPLKWHKGELRSWCPEQKGWRTTFDQAPELQTQLNKLYTDYLFETYFVSRV